jgi:predicted TIM-barrel fold metal-dependent hydrolase
MADVLISSDTHLAEPHDLFTSRLPRGLRDRAARIEHVVDDVEGDLIRVTTFGKNHERARYLLPSQYIFNQPGPVSWDASDPGCDLAAAMVRDLEADGVAGAVVGPDNAREALYVDDHELAIAHARAYNDFLVEGYGQYFDRLAPLAGIPLTDVDDAVEEIERAAAMGLRGLAFPVSPPEPFFTDTYDRIWAATQASGLVATFHVGTGFEPLPEGAQPAQSAFYSLLERSTPSPADLAARLIGLRAMARTAEEAISSLVGSGVPERYPDLHFVFVEFGTYWLAALMASMEKAFTLGIGQDPTIGTGIPVPNAPLVLRKQFGMNDKWPYPLRPSDYVRRQIHVTFQDDPAGLATRHLTGIDSLLWANDYPHPEATYPRSGEAVDAQFASVPARDRDAILGGTTARLFGLSHLEAQARS